MHEHINRLRNFLLLCPRKEIWIENPEHWCEDRRVTIFSWDGFITLKTRDAFTNAYGLLFCVRRMHKTPWLHNKSFSRICPRQYEKSGFPIKNTGKYYTQIPDHIKRRFSTPKLHYEQNEIREEAVLCDYVSNETPEVLSFEISILAVPGVNFVGVLHYS